MRFNVLSNYLLSMLRWVGNLKILKKSRDRSWVFLLSLVFLLFFHKLEAALNGPSLTSMARFYGFTHAIHVTHLSNLEGILTAKKIVPGSHVKGAIPGDPFGNHDAVFLSLAHIDKERLDKLFIFTQHRLPILVFSLESTIDSYMFYANVGHFCGRYFFTDALDGSHFRSVRSEDFEAFRMFVSNPLTSYRNELVFNHSIPLQGLVCLYVPLGTKKHLLERLYQLDIVSPMAGDWSEIIVEVPPSKNLIPLLKTLSHLL